MKMENEIVDLNKFFVPRQNKQGEANGFVDAIFDEFRNLAGTQKGRVVLIAGPLEEGWPSIEDFKKMDKEKKYPTIIRVRNKMQYVIKALRSKINYRYEPKATYIGDGKVILWWKYKKQKKSSGTA